MRPLSRPALTAAVALAALLPAACSRAGDAPEVQNAYAPGTANACVPLPEGTYLFENGVFKPLDVRSTSLANRANEDLPAPASGPVAVAGEAESDAALTGRLGRQFPGLGYPWMGVSVRRGTATLTGTAPDAATRSAAYAAGEAAILADPAASSVVGVIVDGIGVDNGEEGPGAPIAGLADRPSLSACQDAFARTMAGRKVEFRFASDVILPESARLLDAASAIAILCNSYRIEIGAHTDNIGDDAENLALAQRRADAVRAYLSERGVAGDTLTAVGYGETRPVDTSGTREGNALNQRIEFTVSIR